MQLGNIVAGQQLAKAGQNAIDETIGLSLPSESWRTCDH
jgi:hypothetical protein